jgi:hypothetical protein
MSKNALVRIGSELQRVQTIIGQYGGTELANYGETLLVRLDEAGLQALRDEGFQVREQITAPSLQVGGFQVRVQATEAAPALAVARGAPLASGGNAYMLCLAGPLHPPWKDELDDLCVTILESLDTDLYLIQVDPDNVDDLLALDYVEGVSPYYSALKINPLLVTAEVQNRLAVADMVVPAAAPVEGYAEVTRRAEETPEPDLGDIGGFVRTRVPSAEEGNLELVLFEAEDQAVVLDALRNLGVTLVSAGMNTIIVAADQAIIPQLAELPQVRAIKPYAPPGLCNNVATGIIHADTLHANPYGLDGGGQIIGICDTGLDTGNITTVSPDFTGRIVRLLALGRTNNASDPNGHGTHVAGSALGDGTSSNGQIRGMAPRAQMVFQSVLDNAGRLVACPVTCARGCSVWRATLGPTSIRTRGVRP